MGCQILISIFGFHVHVANTSVQTHEVIIMLRIAVVGEMSKDYTRSTKKTLGRFSRKAETTGLDRWLFQRTWVQFLALTWWLIMVNNLPQGVRCPLFDLTGSAHM